MTSTRKSSSSSFPPFAALSAQQKPNSSPANASVAFVAFVALVAFVAAALISDYVRAEQFVFGFPPELEKNSERPIIIDDTFNWKE